MIVHTDGTNDGEAIALDGGAEIWRHKTPGANFTGGALLHFPIRCDTNLTFTISGTGATVTMLATTFHR